MVVSLPSRKRCSRTWVTLLHSPRYVSPAQMRVCITAAAAYIVLFQYCCPQKAVNTVDCFTLPDLFWISFAVLNVLSESTCMQAGQHEVADS